MQKDYEFLYALRMDIKRVLDRNWDNISYTVPGSMEKMIEVKAELTRSLRKASKTVDFILTGEKLNENQEKEKNH